MKPAREPASTRPKPCASLKTPQESCLFAAPCWPSKEENRPWSEISFPLRTPPVRAFDSRYRYIQYTIYKGSVQHSPGSSLIELPSNLAEFGDSNIKILFEDDSKMISGIYYRRIRAGKQKAVHYRIFV